MSDADKRAAREYLKSVGIMPNTDRTTPEQYAAKIHAADVYGDPENIPEAKQVFEESTDPNFDNATAPALDALPEPARAPDSVVEPTQGIPAAIAAPISVPEETSGALPSGGPVIDPLAKSEPAKEESIADRHAKLVETFRQSLANQDYSAGAGQKTPAEAAANWARYTKQAEALATNTLMKEQDATNAVAESAKKSAIQDEDRNYQSALSKYKEDLSEVQIENEKRVKLGLPELKLPEAPVAPSHEPIVDESHPIVEAAVEQAITPKAEEVHAAANEVLAPIRQERTQQIVAQKAEEELQGYAAQDEKRARDAQEALNKVEKESTDEVRASTLHEMLNTGNLGSKLGAAFAVLLGGVSQGITGAKSNPVLDYINTAVEQQANKDKLTLAKKEGLRKLLLEEAQLKVHALSQKATDEYHKGMLQLEAQKLEDARMKASASQQKELQAQLLRARANQLMEGATQAIPTATPEIAQRNKDLETAMDMTRELDPKKYAEVSEKLVVLPNGLKVIAVAPKERVQKFENEVRPDLETAVNGLKDLRDFAKNSSKLDLKARQVMASKLNVLAGQLRIPLTGPGVLTQEEFNRILTTIGNPMKIVGLRDWEEAKLNSTIAAVNSQLKTKAGAIGVQWPMSTRETMTESLRLKGYEPVQIEAALRKKGL